MITRFNKALKVATVIGLGYVGAYAVYRTTNTEIWLADEMPYVIFGSKLSYYLFRPLTYIDGAVTDMRFHIGPHQIGNQNSR